MNNWHIIKTGKMFYLWLEYFEVLSGGIYLVIHFLSELLKLVSSKSLSLWSQKDIAKVSGRTIV